MGVRIFEGVEALEILLSGSNVTGVQTSEGPVSAPIVVNAAGPEARDVAAWVGVDLPVFPKRQQVVVTGPVTGLPENLPCVVEPAVTLFMAPEGQGVLMTLDRERVISKSARVDRDSLPDIASVAAHRIPTVMEAGLQTAWAGLLSLTPDKLPILGPVPGVEGFVCANGLSGHGVMLSRAVGSEIAKGISDGVSPSSFLSDLSIERFKSWPENRNDLVDLALAPYL
jgi:sarcosine oxidase subunit beta